MDGCNIDKEPPQCTPPWPLSQKEIMDQTSHEALAHQAEDQLNSTMVDEEETELLFGKMS